MPSRDITRSDLDIYVDACRNESWADLRGLERAGRTGRGGVYPAPASRFLPFLGSGHALSLAGWVSNLLWPFLAPAVFLFNAMQWSRQARRSPAPAAVAEGKRLWLFFSDALAALSPALLNELRPDAVVMGPRHMTTHRFADVPRLTIFSATRRGDVAAAYFLALRGVWRVIRDLGIRQSSQSYTAFEWFMTARTLNRLVAELRPSELVFLNHYDRWAILFDAMPSPPRHVLVQHGILYRDAPLPVRIRSLDVLHTYSNESADRFARNVLDMASRPKIAQQPPALEFSDADETRDGRFRVLLIGDPLQAERDVSIGTALLDSGIDLELVVKPHPRFSHTPYMKLQAKGALLALERDRFPRANLAICGMSTLGLQYETAGCEVVWYEDLEAAEVVEMIRAATTAQGR